MSPNKKKHFLAIIGDVHQLHYDYLNIIDECENSIQVGDLGFDYSFLEGVNSNRHKFVGGNHDNYSLKVRFDLKTNDRLVLNSKGKYVTKFDDVFEFINMPDHFLGHYGTYKIPNTKDPILNPNIFFMRGAYSIDKKFRTPCYDWFEDEELSYKLGVEVIEAFGKAKPDIMISHDCPGTLYPMVNIFDTNLSITANILTQMFDVHQPKLWIFGHHHMNIFRKVHIAPDGKILYHYVRDDKDKLMYWDEFSLKEYDKPITSEGTRFVCLDELEVLHMNRKLEITE